MKIRISRRSAIQQLTHHTLANLTDEERASSIVDWWSLEDTDQEFAIQGAAAGAKQVSGQASLPCSLKVAIQLVKKQPDPR